MNNKIYTRTKIIATMGPASTPKDVLRDMILSGVDVCRLNFSHGTQDDHLQTIKTIKELNAEMGTDVAILVDLQGPKLRIGDVEDDKIILEAGAKLIMTTQKCTGTNERVYMNYKEFPNDVKKGDSILIDDGKIKLKVLETNNTDIVTAEVVYGGVLSSKKGVNLPDTSVSLPSLTPKDIEDVNFALDQDIDWVALSFVRTVTDIVEIKELIKKKKKSAYVIAKIEKPEAIKEIDNIIDMTDGIMVARGDLGVEVPFDRVPLIQKEIVKKCIEASKPVIIATQMMESMISNFRPTRAEANDVANAVIDGADTLMLSGETSVGKYPRDVITNMRRIIKWTEDNAYRYNREHAPAIFDRTFLAESICFNACKMAAQSNAKAIVTFTHSGYTACRISSQRPKADIFAFTSNKSLLNKLSLIWGVRAFYFDKYDNIDEAIDYSIKLLFDKHLISNDDIIVHVASTPLHKKDRTNMMKISYV